MQGCLQSSILTSGSQHAVVPDFVSVCLCTQMTSSRPQETDKKWLWQKIEEIYHTPRLLLPHSCDNQSHVARAAHAVSCLLPNYLTWRCLVCVGSLPNAVRQDPYLWEPHFFRVSHDVVICDWVADYSHSCVPQDQVGHQPRSPPVLKALLTIKSGIRVVEILSRMLSWVFAKILNIYIHIYISLTMGIQKWVRCAGTHLGEAKRFNDSLVCMVRLHLSKHFLKIEK